MLRSKALTVGSKLRDETMSASVISETFWVERDRYHTAIVLERSIIERFAPHLLPILSDFPTKDQNLIRFGWGDWDYYGSARQSLFKALKALLLPTRSVVEVSCFSRLEELGQSIVSLDTHEEQLESIVEFISKTFKFDKCQAPRFVREEKTGFRYYHARGFYHVLRNCNNWTAKALRKGDLSVKYRFAFSAKSVMKQLGQPFKDLP